MSIENRFRMSLTVSLVFLAAISVAHAQYSGGSGTPNDPYQIATAADLIAFGETPDDYDKHFILTADIDLDPNLPGGRVFDKAVIAPDAETSFTGVFDGNGHVVLNLTIIGEDCIGLFGEFWGEVRNLGLVDAAIAGSGTYVGALLGLGSGWVTRCYSTGEVAGRSEVGGLIGQNGVSVWYGMIPVVEAGTIDQCWSTASVGGSGSCIGGLVGTNWSPGEIQHCYTLGSVVGDTAVGGLVGENVVRIPRLASLIIASIGEGPIVNCYSAASVCGNVDVGGLVGRHSAGEITNCFWDTQSSGQTGSEWGTGLTTAEMQTASTFLEAGWDFVDETENGTEEIWQIVEGQTYPLLSWQKYGGGTGEPNDPYLIYTAEHLNALGAEPNDYDKHFKLMADIDLGAYTGTDFHIIGYYENWTESANNVPFTGTFDGNHRLISNFTYRSTPSGSRSVGLFAYVCDPNARIVNLTLENPMVAAGKKVYVGPMVGFLQAGTLHNCKAVGGWVVGDLDGQGRDRLWGDGHGTGGLVGENTGIMSCCHTTVSVDGAAFNGGLVAGNDGTITDCSASGSVTGMNYTGGLVADNYGLISNSCASGPVIGDHTTGGLVALCSRSTISNCYATGSVTAGDLTGGLVGYIINGKISNCYVAGMIEASSQTGGLVGKNQESTIEGSFWDRQTTGQAHGTGTGSSTGAIGADTSELHRVRTFLVAGWDFVDKTANGTDDIWWILEGKDYPRLWWELGEEASP